MKKTNLNIIDNFFDAYGKQDTEGLKQVLAEDIKWLYPGQNPLSGIKVGIKEVILFFDRMGAIMGKSNLEVKKLVMAANDDYVLECQHIHTNRADGINLVQDMCVLWIFKDGKIIEGKHFVENQIEVDKFFNRVY
jgi:uncharacterized protein